MTCGSRFEKARQKRFGVVPASIRLFDPAQKITIAFDATVVPVLLFR
ncbi:MAG: hypothetical protein ACI83P_000413 [Janthinobacterium sp.]|jgi:hypothetical protein